MSEIYTLQGRNVQRVKVSLGLNEQVHISRKEYNLITLEKNHLSATQRLSTSKSWTCKITSLFSMVNSNVQAPNK